MLKTASRPARPLSSPTRTWLGGPTPGSLLNKARAVISVSGSWAAAEKDQAESRSFCARLTMSRFGPYKAEK